MKKTLFSFILIFITFSNSIFAEVLDINSPAGIIIDAKTGQVIFEKNSKEKHYPASTTKVLTALLALENLNIEDYTVASKNAINMVTPGESSGGFKINEKLMIKDVLYGLLLVSANDGANIIAEQISGSINNFVQLMNSKAKQLGAVNSNFANPSGTHDENHYSCAYDLSLIAKYAYTYDLFKEICNTSSYKMEPTNLQSTLRIFSNTNRLIHKVYSNKNDYYYYPYATGLKTGFTTPAKNTFIGSAKKGKIELINVVLAATEDTSGRSNRYLDSIKMFDYVFNNYKPEIVVKPYEQITDIEVPESKNNQRLSIGPKKEITILTPKSQVIQTKLNYKLNLKPGLCAPIKADDIIGTAEYTLPNTLIPYKVDLVALNNIEKNTPIQNIIKYAIHSSFYIVIFIAIAIFLFILIINIIRKIYF